jgi:hypothetical protein
MVDIATILRAGLVIADCAQAVLSQTFAHESERRQFPMRIVSMMGMITTLSNYSRQGPRGIVQTL